MKSDKIVTICHEAMLEKNNDSCIAEKCPGLKNWPQYLALLQNDECLDIGSGVKCQPNHSLT